MKKLLIIQNEGKALGGVWFVNKAISEKLIKMNYQVEIISIRNAVNPTELIIDPKVKLITINNKVPWGTLRKRDIFHHIKQFSFIKAIKTVFLRKKEIKALYQDYEETKKYIREFKPNYILTSHYQVLDAIPQEYLSKTIHEQHTSYKATKAITDSIRIFKKYQKQIKFIWLTKSTCEDAIKDGFINSAYIYNPIRFEDNQTADVINNKKIITISRISEEKRVDLMVDLVKQVFQDQKYHDWCFEIYGKCDGCQELLDRIQDCPQIQYKGSTNEPDKILKTASINLNTSIYEGFSLSVLEAAYYGIPTITFNFGESVYEEIIDNKTGIIIESNDTNKYVNKLKELIDNQELLLNLSKNTKVFASKFSIDNIINDWIKIFNEIDNKNK